MDKRTVVGYLELKIINIERRIKKVSEEVRAPGLTKFRSPQLLNSQ